MTVEINLLSVFTETLSNDKADVMSSGRLFRSVGPAEANIIK